MSAGTHNNTRPNQDDTQTEAQRRFVESTSRESSLSVLSSMIHTGPQSKIGLGGKKVNPRKATARGLAESTVRDSRKPDLALGTSEYEAMVLYVPPDNDGEKQVASWFPFVNDAIRKIFNIEKEEKIARFYAIVLPSSHSRDMHRMGILKTIEETKLRAGDLSEEEITLIKRNFPLYIAATSDLDECPEVKPFELVRVAFGNNRTEANPKYLGKLKSHAPAQINAGRANPSPSNVHNDAGARNRLCTTGSPGNSTTSSEQPKENTKIIDASFILKDLEAMIEATKSLITVQQTITVKIATSEGGPHSWTDAGLLHQSAKIQELYAEQLRLEEEHERVRTATPAQIYEIIGQTTKEQEERLKTLESEIETLQAQAEIRRTELQQLKADLTTDPDTLNQAKTILEGIQGNIEVKGGEVLRLTNQINLSASELKVYNEAKEEQRDVRWQSPGVYTAAQKPAPRKSCDPREAAAAAAAAAAARMSGGSTTVRFIPLKRHRENRIRVFSFRTLPHDSPLLVTVPGGRKLHKLFAARLGALNEAWVASKQGRKPFEVSSGHRNHRWNHNWEHYKKQIIKKARKKGYEGTDNQVFMRYSAVVAFMSPHETGLAMDIGNNGLRAVSGENTKQRNTAAWKWLSNNAYKFGISPLNHEPWHWECLIPRENFESGIEFTNDYAVRVSEVSNTAYPRNERDYKNRRARGEDASGKRTYDIKDKQLATSSKVFAYHPFV